MLFVRRLISIVVGASAAQGTLAAQSSLVVDSVSSPGLTSNVVGDSPVRRTLVYLPASYRRDSTRRYPRTERQVSRRALVGHSMGGFGALAIGFKHPNVFGLVYAISPCCFGFVGRLAPSSPAWPALAAVQRWQDAPAAIRLALGMTAALDGSRSSPRLFDELPFSTRSDGTIVPNPSVQARWLARMPLDLASAMVRRGDRQPVILLESGSEEVALNAGVKLLRARLDSLRVRYSDTTFVGGHIDRVRERFSGHMLPTVGRWFSQ